jgi:hypothetical protein
MILSVRARLVTLRAGWKQPMHDEERTRQSIQLRMQQLWFGPVETDTETARE